MTTHRAAIRFRCRREEMPRRWARRRSRQSGRSGPGVAPDAHRPLPTASAGCGRHQPIRSRREWPPRARHLRDRSAEWRHLEGVEHRPCPLIGATKTPTTNDWSASGHGSASAMSQPRTRCWSKNAVAISRRFGMPRRPEARLNAGPRISGDAARYRSSPVTMCTSRPASAAARHAARLELASARSSR